MTILHIFPYSARIPGGHSNAIREFIVCQRAAGLDAYGLSPAVDESSTDPISTASCIQEISTNDPLAIIRHIRKSFGATETILHLHAINRLSTDIAQIAREAKIKVVMTSHGQLNYKNLFHAAQKFAFLTACRSTVKYADGLHLLTDLERTNLRLVAPFYQGSIATIPHAISTCDQDNPTASRPLTITHLGRLDITHKGLDLLLRGFSSAGLVDARLILAGPDWNNGRAKLKQLAAQLGCEDRVLFPGSVYGNDKTSLLRDSDIFVAASRWEAFGISLVEAMAAGTPALVSAKANLAPSLARAKAAKVVECSSKAIAAGLTLLASNQESRILLGRRGQEWALAHCSPSSVGNAFKNFYQTIISR